MLFSNRNYLSFVSYSVPFLGCNLSTLHIPINFIWFIPRLLKRVPVVLLRWDSFFPYTSAVLNLPHNCGGGAYIGKGIYCT